MFSNCLNFVPFKLHTRCFFITFENQFSIIISYLGTKLVVNSITIFDSESILYGDACGAVDL